MINIKSPKKISENFLPAIQYIAKLRAVKIAEKIDTMSDHERKHNEALAKKRLEKALAICEGKLNVDAMMTGLKTLPYRDYNVVDVDGKKYLHAISNSVVIGQYKLGEYEVYIPVIDLANGVYLNIHFVPIKQPLTINRHPHHIARENLGWNYHDISHNCPIRNMNPISCFGDFNSILPILIDEIDVVELMRQFWIYLNRYNANSPLITMNDRYFGWAL